MDPDEFNIAGDFFLYSNSTDGERRKSIYERFQRFVPAETIAYIQYCLLRLPFVLLYDYLLTAHFSSLIESLLSRTLTLIVGNDHLLHRSAFHWLFQANLTISVPLVGLILLIFCLWCSDRCLVMFYSYTISLLVIYFDYQMTSLPENHPSSSSFTMCILQLILSSIYTQMLNTRPRVASHLSQTRLCHFAPFALLISRYCLPSHCTSFVLRGYYSLWTLVHLSESLIFHFRSLVHLVRDRFVDEHVHLYRNFDFRTFVTYLQAHISVWTLLKIFWLTKIIVLPLALRIVQRNFQLDETLFSSSLFYGTETIFTLISLACLVSHVMKRLSFRLFRLLHLWSDDVEQIGTLVGVLFFLFLFQTNITAFDVPRRHVPLIEAFCLLLVALFHFVHTILEPALVKVAMHTFTQRVAFNDKTSSILRAFHHEHIYTCVSIGFLLAFDLFLLWRLGEVSTWLFAVTTFAFELLVRLVASFVQFTIYVLDAHQRFPSPNIAEKFLLRLKTLTSTGEFLLGAFLLLNGIDILLFDARGVLRAFILVLHGYLNIVKNLRRAWRFLRDRRTIRRLNSPTNEQIETNNDVCPICYELFTVETTCVTPCSHLFHRSCLEKAFAKSTRCALCSRSIVA